MEQKITPQRLHCRLNASDLLKTSISVKKYLVVLGILLMSTVCNAQLLQWNTYGNVGTETTEPSVYNDAHISSANLTQGSITPAGNLNRFGGSNWFNTGNTIAGNTLSEAIAGNDYIQFIVTPDLGYGFTATSLVFSWDRSATGTKSVALRSSVDGYGSDLGTIAVAEAIGTYTITISGISSVSAATTFRLYGYGATATTGTGGFDVASSVVNVQLNGTTALSAPLLSVSSLTGFGEKCINNTYGPESFTITGTNLTTANVTAGALSGFTYCTTSGGTYTSSLSLAQSGGNYSTVIYVKFNPTTVQSYNDNIVVGGGGAGSVNCSAVGSGVNSSSVTTHPSSQTITAGSNVNFSVAATNAASYQWQENQNGTWNNLSNGGVYSNVTTATMTITGVSAETTGNQYRCVVTSSCSGGATVTSNAATLTISNGPVWLIDEDFSTTTTPASLATTTTGPFISSGTWFSSSATVANRSTNALFMTKDGDLTTPTFANADLLCFWMGHAVGSVSAAMTVEQTTNGTTWTTLATVTDIPPQSRFYFYELSSAVIQIRFLLADGNADIYFDDVMVRSAGRCSSPPMIERILVNSCAATEEGRNEMLLVDVGSAININDLIVTFPSADPATLSFGSYCNKTFIANPSYTDALNTLAGCNVAFEPVGGIIPANSTLVIFTGANPEFTYDFSAACGLQTYCVIYCNNANIAGRFANDPGSTTYKYRYTSIIDAGTGCYDQVYYDDNIPVSDGWQAMYDLLTRNLSYANYGCTEVILPIKLLSFKSSCEEASLTLQWSTGSETNNDHFTLERSADAEHYQKIVEIKGGGNSNSLLNYSFTDYNPLAGTSYYRLVQYNYDGHSETFGPITAQCESTGDNDFQLVNVNNDGVNPHITYYISTTNKVTICVYDINGGRILCDEQTGLAGNRQMNLDINTGAGLYFINLTDGDKVLSTRVFIK